MLRGANSMSKSGGGCSGGSRQWQSRRPARLISRCLVPGKGIVEEWEDNSPTFRNSVVPFRHTRHYTTTHDPYSLLVLDLEKRPVPRPVDPETMEKLLMELRRFAVCKSLAGGTGSSESLTPRKQRDDDVWEVCDPLAMQEKTPPLRSPQMVTLRLCDADSSAVRIEVTAKAVGAGSGSVSASCDEFFGPRNRLEDSSPRPVDLMLTQIPRYATKGDVRELFRLFSIPVLAVRFRRHLQVFVTVSSSEDTKKALAISEKVWLDGEHRCWIAEGDGRALSQWACTNASVLAQLQGYPKRPLHVVLSHTNRKSTDSSAEKSVCKARSVEYGLCGESDMLCVLPRSHEDDRKVNEASSSLRCSGSSLSVDALAPGPELHRAKREKEELGYVGLCLYSPAPSAKI